MRRERADAAVLRNGGAADAAPHGARLARIRCGGDAAFIRKAAQLNRAGVPLKDLALMRDCLRDEPQQFCAELRTRLAATQEDLAGEIARLQQSARLLADLLAASDKAA